MPIGLTVGIPMTVYASAVPFNASIVLHTSAIERVDLVLELLKDTLHHADGVQLVAVDSRRERKLHARLQTLWCSPRNHDGDVNRVSAIEFSRSEIVLRDSLRRHVREVEIVDDWYSVHDIAGEVNGGSATGKDRCGRDG
jgi:hypothetical protein